MCQSKRPLFGPDQKAWLRQELDRILNTFGEDMILEELRALKSLVCGTSSALQVSKATTSPKEPSTSAGPRNGATRSRSKTSDHAKIVFERSSTGSMVPSNRVSDRMRGKN